MMQRQGLVMASNYNVAKVMRTSKVRTLEPVHCKLGLGMVINNYCGDPNSILHTHLLIFYADDDRSPENRFSRAAAYLYARHQSIS